MSRSSRVEKGSSGDALSDRLRHLSRRASDETGELLEGFGQRVQRSVFECDLNEREYQALERKMKRMLKLEEGDNVRIYRLCGACVGNVIVLGNGPPVEKSVDVYII
jgi:CRISPR-associated protein Cas2